MQSSILLSGNGLDDSNLQRVYINMVLPKTWSITMAIIMFCILGYCLRYRLYQSEMTSFRSQMNHEFHPLIYVITPTYVRTAQQPDLTRLAQTLMHVRRLHWIIVEDSPRQTDFVKDLLQRSGLPNTHLNVIKSENEKKLRIRGCSQRNAALTWVKNNVKDGVIYFADDDNAYDIRLFSEIRNTQKVGLVPAGNFPTTGVSSPVVQNGQVVGFLDHWKAERVFPIDMACMAINVAFWVQQGAPWFQCTRGYMESLLLSSLHINLADIEPKANNCTMILVWHTNTLITQAVKKSVQLENRTDTNIPKLLENILFLS